MRSKMKLVVWLVVLLALCCGYSTSDKKMKENLHAIKLPPCQACKNLIESFMKEMERTLRGKFEGGDADWEKARQGSYLNSEVRLVEIQENICNNIERGRDQCHVLFEDNEHLFDEWWFKYRDHMDLHTYLCINELKACCPEDHYGPQCKPCPGYPKNICNSNGKCKGAGTRMGNGKCRCDTGYIGESCNECAPTYYEAYRDDNKMLCSECHYSCKGSCTQAGPKGCSVCKRGWYMQAEKGCMDINECFGEPMPCKMNEFCVNKEGSFSCLACDKSCKTCHGDGPDMCDRCADGYSLVNNVCEDSGDKLRESRINLARYLTYFGLCVATCIIFKKHTVAASLIGLSVALYISVSEYFLNTAEKRPDGTYVFDLGKMFNS